MKFSDTLWQQVISIYQKIIAHPFNSELAQGTLSYDRFIFYMEQDAYYLINFARALGFIAARANSSHIIHHFLNFALGALIAERELHAKFLPGRKDFDSIEPSPACMAYSQYLIATAATAPLEEAIAAVLPCFWIYREVGQSIAVHATENNPYMRWIDTYSSQEFSDGTEQAISILDKVANQCHKSSLVRMQNAFEYSIIFEWHFWNDAYNMELFRKIHLTEIEKMEAISTGHSSLN